jgi:hypothetical protein
MPIMIRQYSAETVESSVKTLLDTARPMLPSSLSRLDQFAQRQLDKVNMITLLDFCCFMRGPLLYIPPVLLARESLSKYSTACSY